MKILQQLPLTRGHVNQQRSFYPTSSLTQPFANFQW